MPKVVSHATRGVQAAGLAVVLSLVAVGAPPSVPAEAAVDVCSGAPRHGFLDVTSFQRAAVECAFWYRLVGGTTVDTYEPEGLTTRVTAAVVLHRALRRARIELPAPPEPRFTDLEGHRYRAEIEQLAHAGILNGLPTDTFHPSRRVSRARMATWTLLARTYVSGRPPSSPPDAFPDDNGHSLERRINQAAALGLAPARPDGLFYPEASTTRGDLALFGAALLRRLGSDDKLAARPVQFEAWVATLSAAQRKRMTDVSWRSGCPVALSDLRVIHQIHHRFDGRRAWGAMVVHREVAADVVQAMRELYNANFPIERMYLVDRYGGSDTRSMDRNNSSAFNCRRIAGTTRWSEHSYGWAIDVNPVQNPYVRGSVVEPNAGTAYLDRTDMRPGMIVRPGPVTDAFDRIRWGWGGDWRTLKDYQHFSRSGR